MPDLGSGVFDLQVQVLSPVPKRNDDFRQKVVVSFCTFIFSFFSLHSSLKLSFPDKR